MIVWLKPRRSSAISDVRALDALHAAVLVLRQTKDFHCSWFLLEISCRVSVMKGRYMTMIVALGRVSQIHEEEKVEVNNS